MINRRKIEDLLPVMQRACREFIRRMNDAGFLHVGISSTLRDKTYQDHLFAQGRTRPGNIVTNARGGQSVHNYGLAFDFFQNIRGREWNDNNFWQIGGRIWVEMGGVWGGNWPNFVDRPHCEFTSGLTVRDLQNGKRLSENITMYWENNKATIDKGLDFNCIIDPCKEFENFAISEENIKAMEYLGVIKSPDYWRTVNSVKYLNLLLENAKPPGLLDNRINNGIFEIKTAIEVLKDAEIITTPEYWKNELNKENPVPHLDKLILNMANRARIVLEKIVSAEARGEDLKGQILVANVILNRSENLKFPTGIHNVVFQPGQFSPVENGMYATAVPDKRTKEAVSQALFGKDYSQGALWFDSAPNSWARQERTHLFDHGGHSFFK